MDFVNRKWIRFSIHNDYLSAKFLDINKEKCIKAIFTNPKTLKILQEEIPWKIGLNISQIWKSFVYTNGVYPPFSIQHYFEQKGEFEKYKDELIFSPFPNSFILDMIFMCGEHEYKSYDLKFVIFLVRNNIIDKIKYVKMDKIFRYAY